MNCETKPSDESLGYYQKSFQDIKQLILQPLKSRKNLKYKCIVVGEARLDFLVGGQLITELKAVDAIHPIHQAQVINYLKATGLELGLLINFNVEQLRMGIKRIVLT